MGQSIERVDMPRRHACISWLRGIDVVGVRFLSQLLPRLLIGPPRSEMIIRTIHGFDLRIDPVYDSGVERSIYYTGSYEKGTLFVLSKLLRAGDTFVDVGANIGLMTVHAARIVGPKGRVVAFEPNPSTCDLLKFNVDLNRLTQVQVLPYAVGSQRGEATIFTDPGRNRGRASLIQPEGGMAASKVEVVRLADQLKGMGPVRLIKMDIEGYELEAVKGMGTMLQGPDRPMLMIECSSDRENSHGQGTLAIFEYLQALGGYRYFKPSKGKERPSRLMELHGHKDFPRHDNVFFLTGEHMATLSDQDIFER
jgi:FkbM family methyltransferase